jgi:hypothetical protein
VKSLSKLQEQKKLLGNNYSYDISRWLSSRVWWILCDCIGVNKSTDDEDKSSSSLSGEHRTTLKSIISDTVRLRAEKGETWVDASKTMSFSDPMDVHDESTDFQGFTKPVLTIIRHGKTEHNKLSLFTGWEVWPVSLQTKNVMKFIELNRMLI